MEIETEIEVLLLQSVYLTCTCIKERVIICVVSQMQKIEQSYIWVKRMACRAKKYSNVLGRKESTKEVDKQSDMQ